MKVKCPICDKNMEAVVDEKGVVWGIEDGCEHIDGILITDIEVVD